MHKLYFKGAFTAVYSTFLFHRDKKKSTVNGCKRALNRLKFMKFLPLGAQKKVFAPLATKIPVVEKSIKLLALNLFSFALKN